jgi:hypothetical protein
MTSRRAIVVALMVLNGTPASAMDFSFALYGDARLVVPPGDESYLDGGLGKLHFGSDDGSPNVHFVEAIGEARLQLTPEVVATATGRVDPNYGSAVDLLEAWVRYRPVSTSEWSWSVKTGAFFPPFSLENDEIGWTDFWTLTPSAINSWVASELRILGAEGTIQWRRNSGTVSLIGAVFGWNENAGTLISERGFNLDDRATGLFERVRLPDATATLFGVAPPLQTHLFTQIDSNPGWYIDLSWEPEDVGGFEVMRYDNDANPAADRAGDYAWHTSFWDIGFETQLGALTVLAQALDGSTVVGPSGYALRTNFRSAYGLVGLDLDQWWLAARIEWFQTRSAFAGPSALLSEDGHAGTFSASWQPKKWLRLTSEVLVSDSTRPERVLTGEAARQIETQLQLALRVYY